MNKKLFSKILNTPKDELLLFAEAYLLSAKVRFYVKFFKIKNYLFLLGEVESVDNQDYINDEIVAKVVKTVKRVSRYSFWRTKCLEEAVTCKILLRKKHINSTLYLGVKKDENSNLIAHAWLKSGKRSIIGGSGEEYTVTKYFS